VRLEYQKRLAAPRSQCPCLAFGGPPAIFRRPLQRACRCALQPQRRSGRKALRRDCRLQFFPTSASTLVLGRELSCRDERAANPRARGDVWWSCTACPLWLTAGQAAVDTAVVALAAPIAAPAPGLIPVCQFTAAGFASSWTASSNRLGAPPCHGGSLRVTNPVSPVWLLSPCHQGKKTLFVTGAGTPGPSPTGHCFMIARARNRCFSTLAVSPAITAVRSLLLDEDTDKEPLKRNSPQHPRWPLLATPGLDGEPGDSRASRSKTHRAAIAQVVRQRPRLTAAYERGGTRADAPGAEGPQRNRHATTMPHRDLSAAQQTAFAAEGARGGRSFPIDDQATIGLE